MEQRLAWTSFGKPPETARDYLSDQYAAFLYRRMRFGGVSAAVAQKVALKHRNRLRKGVGGMSPIGVRDERRKFEGKCIYCGVVATSVDHLIPRLVGGPDSADNLVAACRRCNSSKGARDLFDWAARKRFFPLLATRRYLVLAWRWCERAGVLDASLDALRRLDPPFRTNGLPWQWAKVALARSRLSGPIGQLDLFPFRN